MKHVEVPGTIAVYASALCGHNICAGMALTTSIYACCLGRAVLKSNGVPAKWDPVQPEVSKVLSAYEKRFLTEFPNGLSPGIANDPTKNVDAVKGYFDQNPAWGAKYPLILAVALNDSKKLEGLVREGEDPSSRLSEWDGSTADEWAVFLGRLHCVVALLKAGVDPWKAHGKSTVWQIAEKENIAPLLEMKAELEPVALKAYPPVAESAFGRCMRCIAEFYNL